MSPQSKVITVPPMELSLDQFLAVIRQLDEPTRVEVARVLADTEMDAELRGLIEQLAQASPADDISDAEIQAEIKAVRQEGR
jgi:DNA-binding transcriptional ArsR family regulator